MYLHMSADYLWTVTHFQILKPCLQLIQGQMESSVCKYESLNATDNTLLSLKSASVNINTFFFTYFTGNKATKMVDNSSVSELFVKC